MYPGKGCQASTSTKCFRLDDSGFRSYKNTRACPSKTVRALISSRSSSYMLEFHGSLEGVARYGQPEWVGKTKLNKNTMLALLVGRTNPSEQHHHLFRLHSIHPQPDSRSFHTIRPVARLKHSSTKGCAEQRHQPLVSRIPIASNFRIRRPNFDLAISREV